MAWPGGKDGSGVAQRLINQIPPHDVFVSAFLGDCAILRRKRPAELSIGLDRDKANLARFARNWTPKAELRLYCCDAIGWLRYFATRPARVLHASATRGPGLPESLYAAAQDADKSLFLYLDPPYLFDARLSGRRMYATEMTTGQHAELLAVITSQGWGWPTMVSHYPHPLYADALRTWRTFTYQAMTRSGKMATEQVWMNYPEPADLHDARFAGGEKRERERIRRRVRNWTASLGRMKVAERQAVIDAILSTWRPVS